LRKSIASLTGPKYKARGLDELLDEYFASDPHLSDALTSIIIPSFDLKIQQPVFFSSWQAKKQKLDNAPVKLVCRSTTAAPTYLPPVQFTLIDTKADPPRAREFNMVDGGVAVNNPVGFLFMTYFLQFFPKSFSCQCIHICTSITKNLRGIQLASGLLYQNGCFSFGAQIDPNVQGLF
jgi:patatin-like phospholipase/acyl hydrolase